MSAWRRKAITYLPMCKKCIEQAGSIHELWIELWFEFQKAHNVPKNIPLVRGVYAFAGWCLTQSGNQNIQSATIVNFFESIPTDRQVREELSAQMSVEDFYGMEQAFRYHLTQEEYQAFVAEFLSRK